MEEEEKQEQVEIRRDSYVQEGNGGNVNERVEKSDTDHVNTVNANYTDDIASDTNLGRVDSDGKFMDDQFEQVSFDKEKNVGDSENGNFGDLDNLRNSFGESEDTFEFSVKKGYQPNQNNTEGLLAVEFPANARGLPTPAALAVVLRHTQRLISGPAINSLSHTAGRLEEEESALMSL